jgi:hypothetical protein
LSSFLFCCWQNAEETKIKKKKTLNIVTRKQKNNLINIKYWWVKRGDEEGEKEKQETIATSWSLFLSSFFSFLAFFFFF